MAYQFHFSFEGQISLIADDDLDLKRRLNLISGALKAKSKLGLDFGIKTSGNYWSAIFFNGDNLDGVFSIKVNKDLIFAKGEIVILVDKLPPKIGKSVKLNEYAIELGGFYLDGEGFIAKQGVLVESPILTLVKT